MTADDGAAFPAAGAVRLKQHPHEAWWRLEVMGLWRSAKDKEITKEQELQSIVEVVAVRGEDG